MLHIGPQQRILMRVAWRPTDCQLRFVDHLLDALAYDIVILETVEWNVRSDQMPNVKLHFERNAQQWQDRGAIH